VRIRLGRRAALDGVEERAERDGAMAAVSLSAHVACLGDRLKLRAT
jgi:hypothetical protein